MSVTITYYGNVLGITPTMIGALSKAASSTDNAVVRFSGTSGGTAQNSLMTVSDTGTPNIPTGETYNINGSPHAHTATQVGLGNVTNDAQVKKISSSTDNAIARWDLTTGDAIQDSGVTIDDDDNLNIPLSSTFKRGGRVFGVYWMPFGTVTRVSSTQFTVSDGGGYFFSGRIKKGTKIWWNDSGVHQAMVVSASFATDVLTVNIMGDSLDASFDSTSVGFSNERALTKELYIWGDLTESNKTTDDFYAPYDLKVYGIDIYAGTAGVDDSTSFDVQDDGVSIFTSNPYIGSGVTSSVNNACDDGTVIEAGSKITTEATLNASTSPSRVNIIIYYAPNDDKNLT